MHCSVIERGYDVIEFSNCSTEEQGVSVLYFPNIENAVHCSLIMHGFHNGKRFILCSNTYYLSLILILIGTYL